MIIESPIEIMNLALRHVATNHRIATLLEISPEAEVCRDFYARAVEETMMEFLWTIGSATVKLTELVGPDMPTPAVPTPEFLYGYQYPPEALHLRRLFSAFNGGDGVGQVLWSGNWASGWPWNWDSTQSRLPYKIQPNPNQPGTLMILCSWPCAWAEITTSKISENLYGAKLALALSFRLAHYIAPSLTNGDPAKLGDRAKMLFEEKIREAKAINISEQQDPSLPDSEFVRTRMGCSVEPMAGPYPYQALDSGFDVE